MYGKIQISGVVELVTGMHIGGNSQFAAIGAVDSPVIRDKISDLPIIPGSSLKGKLRTLMARLYTDSSVLKTHNNDPKVVLRLFGSSDSDKMKNSRLLFRDMILSNMDELRAQEVYSATEVKFENTINRLTAVANPRQIERVIRGSKFNLDIIYNFDNPDEMKEDFEALKEGLKLLQYDYIGGNGTRGYGKLSISGLNAKVVAGNISKELIDQCNYILKEV